MLTALAEAVADEFEDDADRGVSAPGRSAGRSGCDWSTSTIAETPAELDLRMPL
jgi:hypothetical protein